MAVPVRGGPGIVALATAVAVAFWFAPAVAVAFAVGEGTGVFVRTAVAVATGVFVRVGVTVAVPEVAVAVAVAAVADAVAVAAVAEAVAVVVVVGEAVGVVGVAVVVGEADAVGDGLACACTAAVESAVASSAQAAMDAKRKAMDVCSKAGWGQNTARFRAGPLHPHCSSSPASHNVARALSRAEPPAPGPYPCRRPRFPVHSGPTRGGTTMAGTVLYERDGHIATITYNRPEALNAINTELRADLNAAWVRFRDDEEAWVAIVTGQGRAFSAGADLRGGGAGDATNATFWETPGLTSLENGLEIWKPVIAAVNGYCLGFACTLVAACDFVIASERAEFGFPEVRIGVPTIQGSIRMPKKVGWQNAMELLLIGERVNAQRAKEMGLVGKVVPHEELLPEARKLAERLLLSAPLAVRATKEVAARGQQIPFTDAVRFGETMRRVAGATEDAKEGMAAAREKRAPTWHGR